MLEFYYDFLDCYFSRHDFELIKMDTESNYLATSANRLDIVRPKLKTEFEAKKGVAGVGQMNCRTPGLVKLESEGSGMIALCSKCYYVDEQDSDKKKFGIKGMSKRQNFITWQRFKGALEDYTDRAENRGFRMRGGQMTTYEQQQLALSAYYDKRWMLPDRVDTEPIEFHMV